MATRSSMDSGRDVVLSKGWLSDLPSSFQGKVLRHSLVRKCPAGTMLYHVGDKAGGLFALVTGALVMEMAPSERGPFAAHYYRPGTWFGLRSVLTGQTFVGLKAVRDAELLYLPASAVNAIVEDEPATWRYFALIQSRNLETALSVCDDLMLRDHASRFVAILLHLVGCRHRTLPGEAPFEVDVGQHDLAVMANVARTTAGSLLRNLERAGHIEMSYRRIKVVSPDGLRGMLGKDARRATPSPPVRPG